MRYTPRLQFGSLATILLVSASGAAAEPAHKTPKECNSELYSRLAAIKAAGETPARFVHDCWWHSPAGQPTAIVQPAAVPTEASREAEVAPPPRPPASQATVATMRHVAASHRVAAPRHAEVRRRHDQDVLEARRLERLRRRVARAVRAARIRLALERHAAPRDKLRGASRWSVAANEPTTQPRIHRERLATTGPTRAAATPQRAQTWTDPSVSAETASAVADLGPTARTGRRMWVRVVAAGEVNIKPAVAVGNLSDRAASASALNCWGQPVLLVGRESNRWSREMVCDDKPAGANEWSAQIYYGGSAAR